MPIIHHIKDNIGKWSTNHIPAKMTTKRATLIINIKVNEQYHWQKSDQTSNQYEKELSSEGAIQARP